MRVSVPKEIHPGEKRVALTPESVEKIKKLGFEVSVESGAGLGADISDDDYRKAGADVQANAENLWASADILLKVRPPEGSESVRLKPGQTLAAFLWPAQNPELLKTLAAAKVTALAMDCVPRISRAQKLDALSSMANIAGYRAVIEAAHHFGRFFTGQITAAGKVPPAKVLVIGAGVAGLAAIGAASGLGAVVRGFDTRPEVKDQVKSMGGEFLELDFKEEGSGAGGYAKVMSPEFIKAEMDLFARQAREVDIIITTALIPGKKAPILITADMVKSMKAGSIIVDMAAEQGGNCELTDPGRVSVKHGVTIIGYTDLPSRLAKQSSQLYGNNLWRLLEELTPEKAGQIRVNMDDEVIRGTTIVREGEITWPPPPPKLSMAPAALATGGAKVAEAVAPQESPSSVRGLLTTAVVVALMLILIGYYAPAKFVAQLTVFVLSCFVGYMVVWNVKAALHTPLMSVTNAISGIIAVGAILQVSSSHPWVRILAAAAILVSTVNIVGGFLVTQRMLKMFKK
jgi:NAD(P) transhydrogenase subunit alpha